MSVITMKGLLEAGVHLDIKPEDGILNGWIYIHWKNGIYIIDLQKQFKKLNEAYDL